MAQILLVSRTDEASIMRAVVKTVSSHGHCHFPQEDGSIDTTLLELVQAIAQCTNDEREIIATVRHLLRSGRVRLVGSFRGRRLDAC